MTVLAPSLPASLFDPMTVLPSRYLRGLGITVLWTLIAYPVYPNFDPVNIVMVYLLGTTVAALRLGRGPSALTAIANTVAFDFFLVPPRYSFYVAETQYLFTLGVMLGVALVQADWQAVTLTLPVLGNPQISLPGGASRGQVRDNSGTLPISVHE